MYRFWDHFLLPLCRAIRATSVCEIGAETGRLTQKIIEYCKEVDGVAYAIDPFPQFPVSEWTERHAPTFVFHEDRSINVLDRLPALDLVIVDGDHNWYTVTHELRILERRSDRDRRAPPVIVLHDVGWPYGRRDMYYDPETIPEGHRHPFARVGLIPGIGKPVEGGFNGHLFNSINEHTVENGVLTAAEDFVSGSQREWRLVWLAGLHGVGVLTDSSRLTGSPDLSAFLDDLHMTTITARQLARVEEERIAAELRRLEQVGELARTRAEAQAGAEECGALRDIVAQERSRIAALEQDVRESRGDVRQRDSTLERLEREIADARHALEQHEKQSVEARNAVDTLQTTVAEAERRADALGADLADTRFALERLGGEAAQTREELDATRAQLGDALSDASFARARLENRETELAAETERAAAAEAARLIAEQSLRGLRAELMASDQRLSASRERLVARDRDLSILRQEIDNERAALQEAHATIKQQRAHSRAWEQALAESAQTLTVVGVQLQQIEQSRSWRFGHALFRCLRVVTFRRPVGKGAVAAARSGVARAVESAERAQTAITSPADSPTQARPSEVDGAAEPAKAGPPTQSDDNGRQPATDGSRPKVDDARVEKRRDR